MCHISITYLLTGQVRAAQFLYTVSIHNTAFICIYLLFSFALKLNDDDDDEYCVKRCYAV